MSLRFRGSIRLGLVAFLFLSIGAAGCATRQTGKAQPSGFLGDYSQLTPGGKGEAQLRYIRPDVDWKKYTAVLIDIPLVYAGSETTSLTERDQRKLTDSLHEALVEALEKDYQIVEEPGPGVLRIRTAITEAQGAKLAMNAVTGIVPQLRLLTMIGGMATDTSTFVGKCSAEAEILDSVTGERLAAGVDQRAGTKDPKNMLNKWADVESAFTEWAETLRAKLEQVRGA